MASGSVERAVDINVNLNVSSTNGTAASTSASASASVAVDLSASEASVDVNAASQPTLLQPIMILVNQSQIHPARRMNERGR